MKIETNRIIVGDCLEILRSWPDGFVQTVVTSPPYWGLRDYGVEDQIGLEKTPEAYVAKLVEIFREVKRILREDGTLWLNLGDTYNSLPGGYYPDGSFDRPSRVAQRIRGLPRDDKLKPKDLVGIPWLVAFALRTDGWYLRSDVVWSKPNPMPESVTDRPTKSHEYLFLLSKSERYFYDADAIREPLEYDEKRTERIQYSGKSKSTSRFLPPNRAGRNIRTVWHIATCPYPDAHFATYPEELCRRPILAGTSAKGACPKCGAPWERVLEKEKEPRGDNFGKKDIGDKDHGQAGSAYMKVVASRTIGWKPTCECGYDEVEPCVVLDPFCGSGTTCLVANNHGRRWLGIELSPEYAKLARKRVAQKAIWEAS